MSANPDIYPSPGILLARGCQNPEGLLGGLAERNPTRRCSSIYAKLPARFPPLFERLLLTFRWADVDQQTYTLLANPPGLDLEGFFQGISKDRGLWESLIPAGYVRFAKGPDMDYDPVCFDLNSRKKNGEMRVVKIDHEGVLCNCGVKVVAESAPTFEDLVSQTIKLAAATK